MTQVFRNPPVNRGPALISGTSSTANDESPASELPARQPATGQSKPPGPTPPLVETDLLLEDVSIDGMCGIY
jgi:mycofactocin precursor